MSKHLNIALGITFLSFYLGIISVLLHNFVSGLLGKEEPFFFSLALFAIAVFLFALIYSSVAWWVKLRQGN